MAENASRLPAYYGAPANRMAAPYDPAGVFQPPPDDMASTLRKLWRRKWQILFIMTAVTAAAAAAAVLLPQRYTAEVQLRIGLPEARLANIESVLAGQAMDAAAVQSESYALQSREMTGRVVERLALDRIPEFNSALREPGFFDRVSPGRLLGMFRREPPADPSPPGAADAGSSPYSDDPPADPTRESVINATLARISVEPMGRSHVIAIRAVSENPDIAARIANTLGRTYIEENMVRRVEATDRADEWLGKHIRELRAQVEKDERAVEDHRRQHGLYASNTETVTSQQLSELNTQLIIAQAERSAIEARLGQATQLAKTASDADTVPQVLNSPLIQALKQQQSTVERRAAELSNRYGERHPSIQNVRAELKDIETKIQGEVTKIIAGLRNEAETARARHEALRSNLEAIKTEMAQDNAEAIRLRALEREAEASRELFQQFLQRSKETSVQRDMGQSDARIISPAHVPRSPSFPPVTLLLALGLIGGAIIGILIALLLEQLDNTFRTDDEVEERTGLPVLSVVPRISRRRMTQDYVLKQPTSEYSEAVRKLEMSLRLARPGEGGKVVMVSSAVPNEGKSGICLSLARMAAASGVNVIVVDCDWRRPQLHSMLEKRNRQGVGDLLAGSAGPEEVVYRDVSGAHMIFAGRLRPRHAHLLCSERMRHLLRSLTRHYDLVLIDTPPVLVGSEVLYLSQLVDQAIYVVRWGHTRRDAAMKGLRQLLEMRAPVAGVVLSRVNTRRYRRYVQYGGSYSYRPTAFERAA